MTHRLPPNHPRPAPTPEEQRLRTRIRDLEQLAERIDVELLVTREQLRTLTRRGPGVGNYPATPKGTNPGTIRRWARENGWPDLPDRGRLPTDVVNQYLTRGAVA